MRHILHVNNVVFDPYTESRVFNLATLNFHEDRKKAWRKLVTEKETNKTYGKVTRT